MNEIYLPFCLGELKNSHQNRNLLKLLLAEVKFLIRLYFVTFRCILANKVNILANKVRVKGENLAEAEVK